jgi:glycine/D-amino acid oxidase-like deaminating enzyme
MAGVANVRNPRLVKSLKAALLALPNVTLREHCQVTGFAQEGGRIVGVQTDDGVLAADDVVLSAGAWSGDLLQTLGLALPVEPVKGQMILFKCAEDFLPSMVLAKGRYAIPRRDGHILVGSTLEHEGYDKTPTAEALASLKASAIELLPALADAEVVGHWAGLRPGSPEGIPYIGAVPGHEGLWLNCGHYRNGLVLAPASCQLFATCCWGVRRSSTRRRMHRRGAGLKSPGDSLCRSGLVPGAAKHPSNFSLEPGPARFRGTRPLRSYRAHCRVGLALAAWPLLQMLPGCNTTPCPAAAPGH